MLQYTPRLSPLRFTALRCLSPSITRLPFKLLCRLLCPTKMPARCTLPPLVSRTNRSGPIVSCWLGASSCSGACAPGRGVPGKNCAHWLAIRSGASGPWRSAILLLKAVSVPRLRPLALTGSSDSCAIAGCCRNRGELGSSSNGEAKVSTGVARSSDVETA
ncbi:hypothetical protein D3C79_791210 [compost metagenome]